jgi:glycosyltransferase involved in cell wall biosynthesis
MKILLTHEMFPPDFGGGGEYVVLRISQGLMAAGVDVRVLTAGDPAIDHFDGISTTRIPVSRYRFNLAVRSVLEHARDVDLIQTFSYHAVLPSLVAGRILRKPVVCSMLAFYPDVWKTISKSPMVGQLRVWWEHFLVTRQFARLIFLNQENLDRALQAGIDPRRALVNAPAIDLESYGPAAEKEDVVLFSSKLDERKGIYQFLAIARALPHIRFRVMGTGPEEARARREAPANVEFVPFERGAPLRRAFAEARIFVLPSKGETFGLAVLEAMASGCAVVSSVPLEFHGAHVGPDDRETMIREVERLYSDRDLTQKMGAVNIELASHFSWSAHIETLLAVYQEVLAEASSAAGYGCVPA